MPSTNPVDVNGLYARAEERAYVAAEQLHRVFNSDATTEVEADDGLIPSVRKALTDNFYFKDPIDWQTDAVETLYNQPRKFVNPTNPDDVTYWWAPAATSKQVIAMGGSPFGDDNWQPWVTGYDDGRGQLLWVYTVTDFKTNKVTVPFKFKTVGMLFINGAFQNPENAYEVDRRNRTITFKTVALDKDDQVMVLFGLRGGIVPSLMEQISALRDSAAESADRAELSEQVAQHDADRAVEAANQLTAALADIEDLKRRVAALEARP